MKGPRRRVIVLGSTGSIGAGALDVARSKPDLLTIVGLSCHRSVEAVAQQAREFSPEAIAVSGYARSEAEGALMRAGAPESSGMFFGDDAVCEMVSAVAADVVLNGIAGSSGLLPSLCVVRNGVDLALANKESVVMAGDLLLNAALESGVKVIPVDSEHAAVFSLQRLFRSGMVAEIILTASGGAFRDTPENLLGDVSVQDALRHPTWSMGPKITVDSATLANKGLEVIEAHHLFGVPPARIKVLIHPQSHVHSLVRTVDGTMYGQISAPDMRTPIQNALTYPESHSCDFGMCELLGKELTFQPVDERRFRMLPLAYEALSRGNPLPIVYNAANEMAVAAFLREDIGFLDIPSVVEEVMCASWEPVSASAEAILSAHALACRRAVEAIPRRVNRRPVAVPTPHGSTGKESECF